MSDKIKLVLDIVNQNFVKGIEDAEKAVADFGKSSTGMKKTVSDNLEKVTKKTKDVTGAWNIFKGAFAANIIAAGFAKLAGAAIEFGKESIEASKIQQEAVNSVANAMKVAGDYSEEALQSHKDFASQLQKNSKIGDETTLSMIALSKSYGLTNDEAQKVIQAAVDLSAATGQSLESAVRNLSGTFNGQIGLLGKMDEGLKSLTKEQLASGAAVDLLAKKYEGTAKGELATFDGALQQAKNAFGDVQEVIGDFITNSGFVRGAIQLAADTFVNLGEAIQGTSEFFTVASLVVKDMTVAFLDFSVKVLESLAPLEEGFRFVFGNILTLWAMTAGTIIQGAIDLGGKFASIFGIELPESMVNFQENVLATAEEIRSGKGGIGSMIEGVEEMRDATQASLQEQEAAYIAHNTNVTANNKNKNTTIQAQEKQTRQTKLALQAEEKKAEEKRLKEIEERKKLEAKLEADRIRKAQQDKELFFQWEISQEERRNAWNKASITERVNQSRQGLNALAGLQKSSNQEAFQVGKAAAIAQATMDTYRAANGAYASLAGIPIVGPALGIAAAAAAVVAGMAQVNSIKSQKFALGGIVAGSSITGDQVPIQVNSGEMILNKQQQTQLLNMANGSGGSDTGRLEAIEQRIEALIARPIVIEIDGSRVAQVVRDQSELGFGGSFA